MDITQELDAIWDLARAGRMREGRERIKAFARRKLTRHERLRLGYLSNFCVSHLQATRILKPLVRPNDKGSLQGSAEERAEYAIALVCLGAYEQGIEILLSIQSTLEARAAGFLAFAYFKLWDWSTPYPLLNKVLSSSGLSDSERVKAKTQLALSLLHGRNDIFGARKLLEELVAETGPRFFPLAHWDALQILTQTYYLERDGKGASSILDRIDKLEIGASDEQHGLVVLKWRYLIALQSPHHRRKALQGLGVTKRGLLRIGHWEQARSCDFYRAIATQDRKLLFYVYNGSRYPALRAKLLAAFAMTEADLPFEFDLAIGRPKRAGTLNVSNGMNDFGNARLTPGGVPQRLLKALASDFYAPPNNARLHGMVYPDEHFNPVTSYDRVEKAIQGLRAWCLRGKVPLNLEKRHGFTHLTSPSGVRLRIERDPEWLAAGRELPPKVKELLIEIRTRFGNAHFKARELEGRLGLSRPTVVAMLNSAVNAGLLTKSGIGPSTGYRIL